jgi:hypothetical protein
MVRQGRVATCNHKGEGHNNRPLTLNVRSKSTQAALQVVVGASTHVQVDPGVRRDSHRDTCGGYLINVSSNQKDGCTILFQPPPPATRPATGNFGPGP